MPSSTTKRALITGAGAADGIGFAIARQLGFAIISRDQWDALSLSSATLRAPDGMDAVRALNALRQADPAGSYDYAHIYNPAGERAGESAALPGVVSTAAIVIGMIDGAIERRHPALSHADITVLQFVGKNGAPIVLQISFGHSSPR